VVHFNVDVNPSMPDRLGGMLKVYAEESVMLDSKVIPTDVERMRSIQALVVKVVLKDCSLDF
jgi:hypothetical protein